MWYAGGCGGEVCEIHFIVIVHGLFSTLIHGTSILCIRTGNGCDLFRNYMGCADGG